MTTADEHYLDHAATSPLRDVARSAVLGAMDVVGNASSLHANGRRARRLVEECRERIAAALDASPTEVVFCSGGTEADNTAIKGLWWARHDDRRRSIVTSPIEHHAVLDAVERLRAEGAEVRMFAVGGSGRVDPTEVAELIGEDPDGIACVSLMLANNEVGTVQPVAEVASAAQQQGIPVHTDAVQAIGALPFSFRKLSTAGVDLASVSAHKIGGPVGVGALLARRGVDLVPLLHGGGQERDLRSGTLDVAGIAGFAAAIEEAVADRQAESARIAGLRDELTTGLRAAVDDLVVTVADGTDPADRLPGIAHVMVPGVEGEVLLMMLDAAGIACANGSACTAGVARASHVALAMGHPEELAGATVRFSLGRTSTAADVEAAVAAFGPAVTSARAAGRQNVAAGNNAVAPEPAGVA